MGSDVGGIYRKGFLIVIGRKVPPAMDRECQAQIVVSRVVFRLDFESRVVVFNRFIDTTSYAQRLAEIVVRNIVAFCDGKSMTKKRFAVAPIAHLDGGDDRAHRDDSDAKAAHHAQRPPK